MAFLPRPLACHGSVARAAEALRPDGGDERFERLFGTEIAERAFREAVAALEDHTPEIRFGPGPAPFTAIRGWSVVHGGELLDAHGPILPASAGPARRPAPHVLPLAGEIGRASCRERG